MIVEVIQKMFTFSVPGDTGGGHGKLPYCNECGLLIGNVGIHQDWHNIMENRR